MDQGEPGIDYVDENLNPLICENYSTYVGLVRTDDVFTPAANSLMTASKNPAAWLVQIRDAGHGLMYQDPDQFNGIVSAFLKSVN